MTPRHILVATCLLVAVTTATVGLTSDPAPVAAQPTPSARAAPARLVGSNSCAAAACHGGDASPGREHLTVHESDPHRHAFSVLFQEGSVRMVRLLSGGHEHAPAHQSDICLRCHGAASPNLGEPLPPRTSCTAPHLARTVTAPPGTG